MFSQIQTLRETLEDLITQHGLAEVLDRLATITHTYGTAQATQITHHLEQATHQALTVAKQQATPPALTPAQNFQNF